MTEPPPPENPVTPQSSGPPPRPSRRPRRYPPFTGDAVAQHWVTSAVGAAATLASAAVWLREWDGDALYLDDRVRDGQVWRLVTSALPHADLIHLAFNLYWLWAFGTRIEGAFGHRAAAGIFLLLGAGSAAAQGALSTPGIGLSGVGYGLFGLLWVLSRRDPRFAGVIDHRTTGLFVGWFLLCWYLTRVGTWNVGNAAHGAGAAFGLLLGCAITAGTRWKVSLAALIGVSLVAAVAGLAGRTPSGAELAYVGSQDLEAGRYGRAADRFRRAVEQDPSQPDWWQSLGFALARLERNEEAVRAYRKAVDLRPHDAALKTDWLLAKGAWGYQLQVGGELEDAIRQYREVVAEDPRQDGCWHNLGQAYRALGQTAEARDAFRRADEANPKDARHRDALRALERHDNR